MTTTETRVLVIGGGMGGLTMAHELIRHLGDPHAVRVIDAGERPGGLIWSEYDGGYRVEWASNGFLDNAPLTLEFVKRLGLDPKVEPSSEAARKRYLYRNGKLILLPTTPGAFMASPLLSLRGRLRVAMEPFARKAPGTDETVHDFAARRIGEEAARTLVDAMVSGIFAGNTKNLSVASALPLLTKLEAEHGGLIVGMIAKMREARRARRAGGPVKEVDAGPGGKLTSFRDGMETLPQALAAGIPEITMATAVEAIERLPAGGYRVRTSRGETIEASVVVVAPPPWVAAELVRPLDAAMADDLAAIPSSPIAVIATGYSADRLPGPLDGFGFLVPRGEGLRLLGCLWDSSIFRFRAPVGKVLLRTMIGGAHDPDVVKLDAKELLAIVRRELEKVLGITAEPEFVRVIQHRRGIPHYPPGHGARLDRIEGQLAGLPGLYLAGWGYRGIAVNRVIEDSVALAGRIAESLASGRR